MRSEWWVSFIAVLIVIGGLAAGAYVFRQKSQAKKIETQIGLIESLQNEGRYGEAFEQIEALLPKTRDIETQKRLEWLAIQTLMRDNKTDDARRRAEAFLEKYPEDPRLGTIHYCLGKVALDQNSVEKAGRHFAEVVQKYPDDPFHGAARFGLARLDAQNGNLTSAKEKLDLLLEADLDRGLENAVKDLLGQVNRNLLFSRALQEGDQFYKVQSGDAPIRIARRFGIEVDLLLLCNNIRDPRTLPVGRRLKIPNVDFSIRIDLSENTLTLLNHGKFFKQYKVRTGKSDRLTPTGQFTIREKLKDPEWFDPETGKRYPPGHPENELGTRWLGFNVQSLGIHGTIHPETIGEYASRGCVGMLKEDVEELYALVPTGTPVTIVGQRKARDYTALESSGGSESL